LELATSAKKRIVGIATLEDIDKAVKLGLGHPEEGIIVRGAKKHIRQAPFFREVRRRTRLINNLFTN